MSNLLAIRSAQSSDVDALLAIRYEAILTLANEKYGWEAAKEWAQGGTVMRVQRAIAEDQIFVAIVNETPAGWVQFTGNEVQALYVQPAQAQQGIGSALLTYAEEKICVAGYRTITLDASWNAEEFYMRRGYQPIVERSLKTGRPMVKRLICRLTQKTKVYPSEGAVCQMLCYTT